MWRASFCLTAGDASPYLFVFRDSIKRDAVCSDSRLIQPRERFRYPQTSVF